MLSWWLNVFGLLLGTSGAFVMYFRPPVHLPENFLDPKWLASQTPIGRKALEMSRGVARLGVLFLLMGFVLQLAAALVSRFAERTA